jgi:acetylornithine deacetylase
VTELARHGGLSLRLLGDGDDDVRLLAQWLSDPRVLEWYEGRDNAFDEARIRAEYAPAVQLAEHVTACIVELDGAPLGYLQLVEVAPYGAEYGFAPDDDLGRTWAIDVFLGEPECWGRGLGTQAVQLAIDHLIVDRRADRVLIDPFTTNVRAIRVYEKAGFRPVKVLPAHDLHEGERRDSLLMSIDPLDTAVGLTAALARIDSINPGLTVGAPGEGEVAAFVAAWCRRRGMAVYVEEVAPGRPNVVAVRRGRGTGPSLLLNAHLDTVGVVDPAAAAVRLGDGRLEGRGVLDTKGGLAAALLAAAAFDEAELDGDLIVAAVCDEEDASIGTDALVATWRADAAVVLEPTDEVIVAAHRGFAVIEADVVGRAAHTSRPDRGVNAVHGAGRVIAALAELDASWRHLRADAASVPAVLVSGVVSRGETFTVPAVATLRVELRTVAEAPGAGSDDEQVDAVVRAIHAAVAADSSTGPEAGAAAATTRVVLRRPPMALDREHPLVERLSAAVRDATGRGVATSGAPYWTDAALHVASGTPAVVFGPSGEGLHEDLEWVSTDSLRRTVQILDRLARTWTSAAARP